MIKDQVIMVEDAIFDVSNYVDYETNKIISSACGFADADLDIAVHVLKSLADRKSYGLLKNDRFKPLRLALKALMSSNSSSSTHHKKGKTAMKRLIKGDT